LPGLMIFMDIISINYIGDRLWDAMDPFKVLKEVKSLVGERITFVKQE